MDPSKVKRTQAAINQEFESPVIMHGTRLGSVVPNCECSFLFGVSYANHWLNRVKRGGEGHSFQRINFPTHDLKTIWVGKIVTVDGLIVQQKVLSLQEWRPNCKYLSTSGLSERQSWKIDVLVDLVVVFIKSKQDSSILWL